MMRRLGLLALALLAACAQPNGAQPNRGAPPADASAIRSFDIATIERLGQEIYVEDIMAARASDMMQAAALTYNTDGLRGWIVEMGPPGLATGGRVRFIRERNGALEAAYDIDFLPGAAPHLAAADSSVLKPEEIAQLGAQLLALNNIERPCSQNYNPVALRDPESDGWLVWALAATTVPKLMIVGGHYRFTISADGKTILRKDALSRSCLNMPISQDPARGTPAALFLTQLVSNQPLETTIYLSLLHRIPLIVAMPDGKIWDIADGKAEFSGKTLK